MREGPITQVMGHLEALGLDFRHLQSPMEPDKGLRKAGGRPFVTPCVKPSMFLGSQAGGEGPDPPFFLRPRLPSPPNRATLPETHASVTWGA